MITITFNDDGLNAALARLSGGLGDMSRPMAEISNMLLVSTRDRMEAGLDPDGYPFTARSPETIRRYEAAGEPFGPVPLWKTGRMRTNSLHPFSGPDHAGISSSAIQAAVMQFGSDDGGIPARPFLGLSDQDISGITEALTEWAQGLLAG